MTPEHRPDGDPRAGESGGSPGAQRAPAPSGGFALPDAAARVTFDVFISYHRGDAEFVAALTSELEKRNVTVWFDHHQIKPGDIFASVLEQALRQVRCVVIVVTPGSVQSRWVRNEYYRALTLDSQTVDGVRLIAVVADDAEPPGFLGDRDWVDFRDPDRFAECVDRLVSGIKGERGAGSHSDAIEQLRGGIAEGHSGAVDYDKWMERRIGRIRAAAKRLRRTRQLGTLGGIAVGGALGIASQSSWLVLIPAITSVPLIATLAAWGITAKKLAMLEGMLERSEALRDGLEACEGRSHPGCRRMRLVFWDEIDRALLEASQRRSH
jgi:hypothetical protein